MPEAEHMRFPGKEMPPVNPDQRKFSENEKKKRLVEMPDGTMGLVDSLEDEIKKKQEMRENN